MDRSFKGGQRDIHVGRVCRDAVRACAQYRKCPVVSLDRGAAGARRALVAGHRRIAEVDATGWLQQVAGRRRHITQLRRGAGKQRLGEHGILALDYGVMSQVEVANERPDLQPPVLQLFDVAKRQMIDVDHLTWALDVELHEIDQGRATGNKSNLRSLLRRL